MQAVRSTGQLQPKCTPNVLPCRIDHDGAVDASPRYWSPRESSDGKKIAYFRGRRLEGREVKIPAGYQGIIVSKTDQKLQMGDHSKSEEQATAVEDEVGDEVGDEEGEDEAEQVKILEQKAPFDEVIVWAHENSPDESSDAHVKGMQEWISFAEMIHVEPTA